MEFSHLSWTCHLKICRMGGNRKDQLRTCLFDRVQDGHWDTLADEIEAKILDAPASPELKIFHIIKRRENLELVRSNDLTSASSVQL